MAAGAKKAAAWGLMSLILGSASASLATPQPTPADAAVIAVAAEADHPPEQSTLKPVCAQQTEGGVITFVAGADGKILLTALSAQPLADVQRDIWLRPQFARAGASPSETGTQDWAYVYDGNGDGVIDHMAFLMGALPTEPRDTRAKLPNVTGDHLRIKDPAMLDRLLNAMRFGFWQVRDEDGDTVPDSMAMPARRKDTGWYRGWAIFDRRATSEDASCRFIDREGRPAGSCRAAEEPGAYENSRLTTHVWVRDPGPIFSAILDAAAACHIQPGQVRSLPSQ